MKKTLIVIVFLIIIASLTALLVMQWKKKNNKKNEGMKSQNSSTGLALASGLSACEMNDQVLEIGLHESITPMLHELCRQHGKLLLTVDTVAPSKSLSMFDQDWHKFKKGDMGLMSRLSRSEEGWGLTVVPSSYPRLIYDLRTHSIIVIVVGADKSFFKSKENQKVLDSYKYVFRFADNTLMLSNSTNVESIGKYYT